MCPNNYVLHLLHVYTTLPRVLFPYLGGIYKLEGTAPILSGLTPFTPTCRFNPLTLKSSSRKYRLDRRYY